MNKNITAIDELKAFSYLSRRFQITHGTFQLRKTYARIVIAGRNICKGETIAVIPSQFFISPKMNIFSPLAHYLDLLQRLIEEEHEYFSSENCRISLLSLLKDLFSSNKLSIIYLLELRFASELRLAPQHLESEMYQILQNYMALLPKQFCQHPMMNRDYIRFLHPKIEGQLGSEHAYWINFAYQLSLILENYYRFQRSFESFLEQNDRGDIFGRYIDIFSWKNIEWAVMVLRTRQFSGGYLVPLLDMFNHSTRSKNASWNIDKSIKKAILVADRDIPASRQIIVSYGNEGIHKIYSIYGFTPAEDCFMELNFGPQLIQITYLLGQGQSTFINNVCKKLCSEIQLRNLNSQKKDEALKRFFECCKKELPGKQIALANCQKEMERCPFLKREKLWHLEKILWAEAEMLEILYNNKEDIITQLQDL